MGRCFVLCPLTAPKAELRRLLLSCCGTDVRRLTREVSPPGEQPLCFALDSGVSEASEAIFRQEVLLSVSSASVTDRGLARNAALQMLSHGSAVPPGWQPRPPSAEGAGRALQAAPQQRIPQKSTPVFINGKK